MRTVLGSMLRWAWVVGLGVAGAVAAADLPKAVDARPTAFLWEVSPLALANGKSTQRLWLFGTVHVGRADFYPLPAVVEKAFGQADMLVVEADITDHAAMQAAAPAMLFAPPDTIETRLPAPLVQRLRKQLDRLGIPFDAAKTMRPFILAGLLAVVEYGKQGFDPQQGVDGHFIRRAVVRKMPIIEIEGVKQQMSLLSGLPDIDQEAFLENSLHTLESGEAATQMRSLVDAWQAGDALRLEKAAADASRGQRRSIELEEQLLYARNRQMLAGIEGYLAQDKVHFVAVGALHLTGKRGIVEGLRAKGFVVTQR